jgi:hypothetical protein
MLYFIKKHKELILVILVYLLSSVIRLKINFATDFIPGNISAFYLVQVRSIIEAGRIHFNDFPLLFWMQALPVYLLTQFEFASTYKIIDISVRAFDSTIPPLLVFVTYYFSKKTLTGDNNWINRLAIVSFSVTYITFFELISDYQKNSFSLILIMAVVTVISRLQYYNKWKTLIALAPLVVVAGTTHFGSFIVIMALLLSYIFIDAVMGKSFRKLTMMIVGGIILIIITYTFIYITSPHRAEEFLRMPFGVFDNPIIAFWVKGIQIITPAALATSILINVIALLSIIKLVKNYNEIEYETRVNLISFITIALLLSSPLLGIAAADRIQFISYLFGIPLLAFLFNYSKSKLETLVKIITIGACVISIYFTLDREVYSVMNKEIYEQLEEIEVILHENKRELFVARHGMEFWVSLILREDVAREDHLVEEYWKAYDDVLFINQKKGVPDYKNAGTIGMQFREPFLPQNSKLIFSNEYFDVYKSYFPPKDISVFKIGVIE